MGRSAAAGGAGGEREAAARIEAALYSAGRPLTMDELVRASGTGSRTRTGEILLGLVKRARSAFRAIEIAALPDGSYVFQLKPEYSSVVRRYASKPILPKATLKTLSYIAYQQPISSKQLVETRGTGVYAHLKELRQIGYVSHQNVGRLKIYGTTEKFQKYFGIRGDQDTLREKLFSSVRRTAGTAPGAGGSGRSAGAAGGSGRSAGAAGGSGRSAGAAGGSGRSAGAAGGSGAAGGPGGAGPRGADPGPGPAARGRGEPGQMLN